MVVIGYFGHKDPTLNVSPKYQRSINIDYLISGTILQVICRGMAESLHEEHRHSRERPLSAALSSGGAHEKDMRKHMRRM